MSHPDICIMLTIYNQSLSSIEKSIRSFAKQTGVNFEVIFADDHSTEDPSPELIKLCDAYGLQNYKIVRHERNLQTVGNILFSLKEVTAPYVKVIGAGDELYSESTLHDIFKFCKENQVKGGFGNIIKDVDSKRFFVPKNCDDYPPNGNRSRKELFKHQVIHADWIPGGAQFFKTSILEHELSSLYNEMGLRYCEDFAGLFALKNIEILHLDQPILIYEWGGGISTNGNIESRKRLYKDHENVFKTIMNDKPFGLSFLRAGILFKLKKFIALRTPFYSFFQKKVADSYSVEITE